MPLSPPLIVVAAALIVDGQVLVQRRPSGRSHAGLWEFPGGKVEPGEAPCVALARELNEELAIAVNPSDLTPLGFATEESSPRPLVLLLYACRRWTGTAQAIDAAAIAWCDSAGLARLAMPPVDLDLLSVVNSALTA